VDVRDGDNARAGSSAREARGDYWDIEPLQRSGDVDALPARERQPATGAVSLALLEVRHCQRAIECRIHRHRDDQGDPPGDIDAFLACEKRVRGRPRGACVSRDMCAPEGSA